MVFYFGLPLPAEKKNKIIRLLGSQKWEMVINEE